MMARPDQRGSKPSSNSASAQAEYQGLTPVAASQAGSGTGSSVLGHNRLWPACIWLAGIGGAPTKALPFRRTQPSGAPASDGSGPPSWLRATSSARSGSAATAAAQGARASAQTSTRSTPAARKTRAHSPSVAPVVMTSSSTATCAGSV
jgi:hypothetical protein